MHDSPINVEAAKKALLTQNIGLPPTTYTSESVFDFKLKSLFGRSWTCFAPLGKLEKPGSVIKGQVGNIPVIVTRDKTGEIHGFVNACRHRGYTVVENDKVCKALTCRYHAWSYDLAGNLLSAPDSADDFDKSEIRLLPISVETWAQFIFVNPDPDAESLLRSFEGLDDVSGKMGFDKTLDRYRFIEMTESEQLANWKLWWENATECYHCPTIHASSFGAEFQSDPGTIRYESATNFTSTSLVPSGDDPSLKPATTLHLFPGCHLVQETGMMVMSRIIPRSPDATTVLAYYFAEEGADAEQLDKTIAIWKQTYAEDFDVVRHQQLTLRSGRTQPYRYVPSREFQVIQHVENMLSAYERSIP